MKWSDFFDFCEVPPSKILRRWSQSANENSDKFWDYLSSPLREINTFSKNLRLSVFRLLWQRISEFRCSWKITFLLGFAEELHLVRPSGPTLDQARCITLRKSNCKNTQALFCEFTNLQSLNIFNNTGIWHTRPTFNCPLVNKKILISGIWHTTFDSQKFWLISFIFSDFSHLR